MTPTAEQESAEQHISETTLRLGAALALIGAVSLVDEPLYNATKSGASPARDAFFARVTHLGDGLAALALSAALWPHDRDTAQLVVNAGLRVGVASVVLKSIISRARPYEDAADCAPYRFGLASCVSMPSGHTATAFSMAHVLAHQYPKQSWLWYGLAVLAGWSRVETNNHWPSDVVAGALLGLWAADSALKQRASTSDNGTGGAKQEAEATSESRCRCRKLSISKASVSRLVGAHRAFPSARTGCLHFVQSDTN